MEVDKSRASLTSGEKPLLLCGEKRNLHLALRLQAARRRFPFAGTKRNLHLALRLQAARRRFPFVPALRRPHLRARPLDFFHRFLIKLRLI